MPVQCYHQLNVNRYRSLNWKWAYVNV